MFEYFWDALRSGHWGLVNNHFAGLIFVYKKYSGPYDTSNKKQIPFSLYRLKKIYYFINVINIEWLNLNVRKKTISN